MNIDDLLNQIDNLAIFDSFIVANKKINEPNYKKIMCSISGGSDSDDLLDICSKLDASQKVTYVFFDTGLEYQATKEHLKYLEEKYGVEINVVKAKNQFQHVAKNMDSLFFQNRLANGSVDYKGIISSGKISLLRNCYKNILDAKQH